LICAVGLFGLGLYYIFCGSNLGPPVGFIVILLGGLCLGLYFAFKALFKTKMWGQVIIEAVLILLVFFFISKLTGKTILHPAPNYHGYIFVVDGVNGKPELKPKSILDRNTDVFVPDSGIVFTSSAINSYLNTKVVVDSTSKRIKLLAPGNGIAYAIETLTCGGKKYTVEVFYTGAMPPGWRYKTDTLNRRSKMELACKMMGK